MIESSSALFWGAVTLFAGSAVGAVVQDARYRKVSDFFVLGIVASGMLYNAAISDRDHVQMVYSVGLAIVIIFVPALIFFLMSRRSGMGIADFGLAISLSLWLRPSAVPIAILAAVAVTGLVAIMIRARPSERIPFAPGLVAGYSGTWVFGALLQ